MTVKAHVKDNKTGLERTVMPKAYALIPKRYTFLGWVDQDMNPVDGPEIQVKSKTVQKKRDVEPAVNEPRKKMTPEELEAKKAELRQMNEDAIQKVKDEQAKKESEKGFTGPDHNLFESKPNLEVVTRKKPGPKPKIKNEA